jgi:hypothetical protein
MAPVLATGQERLPASPDIESTIQSQLDAFSTGNVFTAWTFASPTIQQMFQHPMYFGAMVERGYPMVWQPGETTYLGLREEGDRLVQQVQILDQTGRGHLLDYEMVQIDGRWRIAGVTVLRGQHLGV